MLRDAAVSACVLTMALSAVNGLCPSERMKKDMQLISVLIVLLVTLPMITGVKLSFPEPLTIEEEKAQLRDYSDAADKLLEDRINGNICAALREALIGEGIYPAEISVTVNNSGSGSISITKARVVLADSGDIPAAERVLTALLSAQDGDAVQIVVTAKGEGQ